MKMILKNRYFLIAVALVLMQQLLLAVSINIFHSSSWRKNV